jgi:hypothetical protein
MCIVIRKTSTDTQITCPKLILQLYYCLNKPPQQISLSITCQSLRYKIGHHSPIVQGHAGTICVEDADDAHFSA